MDIKWIGAHTNNFEKARRGYPVRYIVLHWIVGTLESADATFQNPNRQASAHFGVGDNDIHQYVKETDTAYTNGNFNSNLQSITIEHEGSPTMPITDATYETSAQLVADIAKRYEIPLTREFIKGHKEVSDKPTQCPGTLDIDRIIRRAKELSEKDREVLVPAGVYEQVINKSSKFDEVCRYVFHNNDEENNKQVNERIAKNLIPADEIIKKIDFLYKEIDRLNNKPVQVVHVTEQAQSNSTVAYEVPTTPQEPITPSNQPLAEQEKAYVREIFRFLTGLFGGGK